MDVTKLTREALKEFEMGTKEKDRAKNMFVLGLFILDVQPGHGQYRKLLNRKVWQERYYFTK